MTRSTKPGLALLAIAGLVILYLAMRWRNQRPAGVEGTAPNKDQLAAEIQQLRQLAAAGDWQRLAEKLDQSLVSVPAGEFQMGSNQHHANERPQHAVYLDAFEIDRYEVTQAQYRRFLEASGRPHPAHWPGSSDPPGWAGGRFDYPVVGVTRDEAEAYCAWAGKRLPSEAEWEKTCRGVDGRTYPWGDNWRPEWVNASVPAQASDQAAGRPKNIDEAWALALVLSPTAGSPQRRPVGDYPDNASPYGALDMAGNASEWVADWYNWAGYQDVPNRNPLVTRPRWNRCLRGSAWYDPYGDEGWVQDLSRCSARNSSHTPADPRVGFRCARSVPTTP